MARSFDFGELQNKPTQAFKFEGYFGLEPTLPAPPCPDCGAPRMRTLGVAPRLVIPATCCSYSQESDEDA